MPHQNDILSGAVLEAYDDAVDGIPLEDAIDVCETVLYGIKTRLSGLESDLRNKEG